MRNILILMTCLVITCFTTRSNAQELEQNKLYTGAQPAELVYKAIYQLDQESPEIIKKTIRNINNLLDDPRLKGNLQVELVAFSGGTEAFRKGSEYEEAIKGLIFRGVLVAQCMNTLQERNIDKRELYDFLAYVPTGNGELLIRANEGWTIIKP